MPTILVTIAGAVAVGVEAAAAVCVAAAVLAGDAADVGAAARCRPSGMPTATAMMPTATATAFPGTFRRLPEW